MTLVLLRLRASLSSAPATSSPATATKIVRVLRGPSCRRRCNTAVVDATAAAATAAAPTVLSNSNYCCGCSCNHHHHHIHNTNNHIRWHSSLESSRSTKQTLEKGDVDDDDQGKGDHPSSSNNNNNNFVDATTVIDAPRRTILTPPVTTTTNTDQIYESRSEMVGFDVHDGTVPTTAAAAVLLLAGEDDDHNDDDDESESKAFTGGVHKHYQQSRHHKRDRKEYGSLMDPYYVPPQEGLTHLIQGGTPCDISSAGSRHRQPYRLAEYGEESVYTLVLLRHGER